ncbi:MAG: alpha/beta fold hydrolase [Casimicrobiaceae bacterium]
MSTHDDVVSIPVDGEQIQGTLVAPSMLVPGVLFVHGWGGSQQQYTARAHAVAALGCVCLTFDLRGHADTRSRYDTVSREDNLRDVTAAYELLARHPGVDPTRIAVVGSSYGGYLAAILCATASVQWLALRSPALYRDADWRLPKAQLTQHQGLGAYRLEVVRSAESRALQACAQFLGDVLMVESEQDLIVPHQVIANYRTACSQARSVTYRVIAGADHGLSTEPAQSAYSELLVSWIKAMIAGRAPAKDLAPELAETAIAEHA